MTSLLKNFAKIKAQWGEHRALYTELREREKENLLFVES